MPRLKNCEKIIKNKLTCAEPAAKTAFEELCEKFANDDLMYNTQRLDIIHTIYCGESEQQKIWKIAIDFNVSERTLYRYRYDYVKWFTLFYNKHDGSEAQI